MGNPVYFLGWNKEPGTGQRVVNGDEYIEYNFTEVSPTASIMSVQRSGSAFFELLNDSGVKVSSASSYLGATTPAFEVQGLLDHQAGILRVYDKTGGQDALVVKRATNSTGRITEFLVGNPSQATADSVGARFSYNTQTATPLGKVATFGYIGAGPGYAYNDLLNVNSDGTVHLAKSSGANLVWDTDGGGTIGGVSSARPSTVYAATSVVAPTLYGGTDATYKSSLTSYSLSLSGASPGSNNKTIYADDGTADKPAIQFDEATNQWQFRNSGTVFSAVASLSSVTLQTAYTAQVAGGLNPVQLQTLNWEVQIDDDAANWIVNNEAGTARYIATDYTTNSIQLGSSSGKYVTVLGTVNSDIAFDGNNRNISNSGSAILQILKTGTGGALNIYNQASGAAVVNIKSTNSDVQIFAENAEFGVLSATVDIDSTTSGGMNITAGGSGPVNIAATAGSTFSVTGGNFLLRTLTSGELRLYSATAVDIDASAGNITLDALATYDIVLSVADNASSDILFKAHNSNSIPFNSATAGQINLTTTAQNLVGAINEVASSVGGITWDGIYANDKALDINSTTLTFTQTNTSSVGFKVSRGLASGSTNSPIMMVSNEPASGYDDQPALWVNTETNGGDIATGPKALDVHISSKAAVTSGLAYGLRLLIEPHVSDSSGVGYFGSYAVGSTVGSAQKFGFYADENWTYGVVSQSPVGIGRSNLTTSDVALSLSCESDGITSAPDTIRAVNISIAGDPNDTTGAAYGIFLDSFVDNGGDLSGTAVSIGSDWTYGISCVSPTSFALSAAIAGDVVSTISCISGGLTSTLSYIRGAVLEVSGSASDTNGIAVGLDVFPFIANSGTLTHTYGVKIGADWEYGVYSSSNVLVRKIAVSGSGSGQTWVVESSPLAPITGLPSGDQLAAFKATISDDGDDASPKYYGFYATTTNTGPDTSNKYGFYIDTGWQPVGYSFYSGSGLQHFYSSLGTITNSVTLTDISLSATLNSNGNAAKVLSISATPGADADGTLWTGISINKFSNTEKFPSKAIDVPGGSYYWDYALYAEDSSVYCDTDFSTYTYAGTHGIFSVASSNATALSSGDRYIGLYVNHTGNASDSGGTIYGSYVGGDGNQGASSYRGYYAGSACDFGFYADGAPEALYVVNGRIRSYATSNTLVTTATGQYYSQYSSSNIASGNYLGYHARFVHGAADSGGYYFTYMADTTGTKTGVTTVGYRAQNSLDIGFDSYAATNNFIRGDDIYTGTSPVVVVQNGDNDATGGVTPALRVINTYSNAASSCIDINSAYSSATEGTRRAITLTAAKTNRRHIPTSSWLPHSAALNSEDFRYAGSTTADYWTTDATSNGDYVTIPLFLPHRCVLATVVLSQNCPTTATGTNLPYIGLYYKTSGGTLTLIGSLAYAASAGSVDITLSPNANIDNSTYEYVIRYRNCAASSSGATFVYYCYVDYEISDLSAPCGW